MPNRNGALRGLVADVAAAYFANSHVSIAEIPDVLGQIARSLAEVDGQAMAQPESAAARAPAAPGVAASALSVSVRPSASEIRRSITEDGLISFEDGRRYKTLKRHLASRGMTPADYREKWGLPADYPMVCASSSAKRSALAKQIGLGQKPGSQVRKAVARTSRSLRPRV